MDQLTLTDALAAQADALDKVQRGSDPPLNGLYLALIHQLAGWHASFTTDALWALIELNALPHPREGRVLGALMKQAARKGWIEATPMTTRSHRKENHARPVRIWRSRLVS